VTPNLGATPDSPLSEQPKGRGWRLVLARRATVRAAVPASVRRFARRARRRRLRTALPWLAVLLVLAVVGVGAGVVYGTSLLGVSTVLVEGNHDVPADDVRLAVAVPAGTPLARVDPGAAARRVRRLPPILRATVRRVWPHTLIVRVVERTPVAVVPLLGGFSLLDATGVPFRQLGERPTDLPLVRLVQPGPQDETTRAALAVLAALPPALLGPLVELVAEAPARIRLELSDERIIIWGDATENAAKVRVATALLSAPENARAKTLDVSAPSVVTVR
jgi:cell division protein FtsQ